MNSSLILQALQALKDHPEIEECLQILCVKQRTYYRERAALEILNDRMTEAHRQASYAACWDSVLAEFDNFLKNEARNVKVV